MSAQTEIKVKMSIFVFPISLHNSYSVFYIISYTARFIIELAIYSYIICFCPFSIKKYVKDELEYCK